MTVCCRLFSTGLLAAAMLTALWSCKEDVYETGDGDLSYLRADFAMAYTDSQAAFFRAETDEGNQLSFSKPYATKWATVADSVYRALVYYNNKVEDGKVEVVVATQVLTVWPMQRERLKKLITDPVHCESAWLSKDAAFLNLGLRLKTGTPDQVDARQSVGVLRDTVVTHPSGHRLHEFTLFHDQNGVPEYYSSQLWVSLRLSDMEKADTVVLHVNTYDGMKERRLVVE